MIKIQKTDLKIEPKDPKKKEKKEKFLTDILMCLEKSFLNQKKKGTRLVWDLGSDLERSRDYRLGVSAAGFVCFPVYPFTVLFFSELVSRALSLSLLSLSLSCTNCVAGVWKQNGVGRRVEGGPDHKSRRRTSWRIFELKKHKRKLSFVNPF